MKRFGAMAAAAMIVVLLALPLGLVSAQGGAPSANLPPAFLFGTAMADGLPVGEGTMITAMAGDQKVGSTMVMGNGKFGPLELMQPTSGEMMISFMVGERTSEYMYEWMSGGREIVMLDANLTGSMTAPEPEPGPAGSAGPPGPPGVPGPAGQKRRGRLRRRAWSRRRGWRGQGRRRPPGSPGRGRTSRTSGQRRSRWRGRSRPARPVPWASSRSSWPSSPQ